MIWLILILLAVGLLLLLAGKRTPREHGLTDARTLRAGRSHALLPEIPARRSSGQEGRRPRW